MSASSARLPEGALSTTWGRDAHADFENSRDPFAKPSFAHWVMTFACAWVQRGSGIDWGVQSGLKLSSTGSQSKGFGKLPLDDPKTARYFEMMALMRAITVGSRSGLIAISSRLKTLVSTEEPAFASHQARRAFSPIKHCSPSSGWAFWALRLMPRESMAGMPKRASQWSGSVAVLPT